MKQYYATSWGDHHRKQLAPGSNCQRRPSRTCGALWHLPGEASSACMRALACSLVTFHVGSLGHKSPRVRPQASSRIPASEFLGSIQWQEMACTVHQRTNPTMIFNVSMRFCPNGGPLRARVVSLWPHLALEVNQGTARHATTTAPLSCTLKPASRALRAFSAF